MRILLTGKTGQVGSGLERSLQGLGEIVAVDRSVMDLADLDQVRDVIRDVRPNIIVNPAAYTAVDKAESEPGLALRVNGEAPGVMMEEAKRLGAALIHFSTDYVFDGRKRSPYVETDPTGPINVYGRTKLAGEQAIQQVAGRYMILRTSWVYGTHGKNFLRTILRLAGERDELRIVGDQHGAPTWSATLADVTATIIRQATSTADSDAWWAENAGVYHASAAGNTTWAGFAQQIVENANLAASVRVIPIATPEYPLPALRPQYSVMSTEKLATRFTSMPDWATALKQCQK
jgi:dTDP-4-dehydrorhamnose reductase